MINRFVSLIIVAAGSGQRMGMAVNKQFLEIADKPIIAHTLECFINRLDIDEIIIVIKPEEIKRIEKIVGNYHNKFKVKLAIGGKTRVDSVNNGFLCCEQVATHILVHDGARPFVLPSVILRVLEKLKISDAVVPAVKVKDTLKNISGQSVDKTLNRDLVVAVQTPQGFEKSLFKTMYQKIAHIKDIITDDAFIAEKLGYRVDIVGGDHLNIKITTPEDLIFGRSIYKYLQEESDENRHRL